MTTRYVPGSAAILVGERGLVATAREHAGGLIALVGADLVVLSVIDSLSSGSLANLPDFACVVVDGADLRIVVRGGFVARVGEERWSGEGVATWREQTVVGGAGSDVVIELPDGADGPELPVTSGIVLASRATWSSAPVDALASAPVSVSVPEPVEPAAPLETVDEPAGRPGAVDAEVDAETLAEIPVVEAEEQQVRRPDDERGGLPADQPAGAEDATAGPAFPPPGFPPPAFPPPSASPSQPVTPAAASFDPEVTVTESDLGFDAMFGATVLGDRPETGAAPPAGPTAGDHDGRTITAAQLKALREQAAREQPAVHAAVVLPDGVRHAVRPRLLIGRRPQARQVSTAEVPTLVTVSDPYVSSTHLEAAIVDGRVLVTDLSTNGTLIIRPGQAPEQLTRGVATEVADGTRLSLSDDLTVSMEVGTEVRADARAGG